LAKRRASKSAAPRKAPGASKSRALEEAARYDRLEAFDRNYGEGSRVVAGVDEAGRGALAGPVVSAAVVLPEGSQLHRVFDSKQLTEDTREDVFGEIVRCAETLSIAFGHPGVIDRDNILRATLMTMHRAVDHLRIRPGVVLVDGKDSFQWNGAIVPVKKGDSLSLSIAAASIVAKVARDRMMRRLHRRFPDYNFAVNKGYGTKDHLEAISRHGAASVHRRTFLAKIVENNLRLF